MSTPDYPTITKPQKAPDQKRRGTKDSFCNNSTEREAATDRGSLREGGLYSPPASAHLLTTIVVGAIQAIQQASDKNFSYRRLTLS